MALLCSRGRIRKVKMRKRKNQFSGGIGKTREMPTATPVGTKRRNLEGEKKRNKWGIHGEGEKLSQCAGIKEATRRMETRKNLETQEPIYI